MTHEQRLSQLESRCRLQSRALMAAILVMGLALLVGAKRANEPQKLQVSELEVVDGLGRVRIRLGDMSEGDIDSFGAKFFDANGKLGAFVVDYGQVVLHRGEGSASLLAIPDGASLQVSASGSRPRAMLYARDDHSGIQLRDTHGEISMIRETPRVKAPGGRIVDPFEK